MKNMVLYGLANWISLFGTSVYTFAIGLYVLKSTGSGLSFATTLAIGIVSTILINPFAGVMADRLDKKKVVIITDLLNAFVLVILYVYAIDYTLSLMIIYLSTFLINAFSTIYGISMEAAKPNLVTNENLLTLNSLSKLIESASTIIGPMVGGIAFALMDIKVFILVNGISFLVSALLQLGMNFNVVPTTNVVRGTFNVMDDLKEAYDYLKAEKWLIKLFMLFIVLNFFMGMAMNVPIPFIMNNVLKISPELFGLIQAGFPVGMIIGALVIKKIMKKFNRNALIKVSTLLLALCMVAIGVFYFLERVFLFGIDFNDNSVQTAYFMSIMIFTGIAVACIDIPLFMTLQVTIPESLRGRVLSIGISSAKVILPLAIMISGVLMNQTSTFFIPIVSGILLALFTLKY